MTNDAKRTLQHAILTGIAKTGKKYIKPEVDCAGLVDSILEELEDPAIRWAIKDLSDKAYFL